jgi:hypothetical protein
MKIGVVGYSSGKFDEDLAEAMLELGFVNVLYYDLKHSPRISLDHEIEVVTGLTNVGIPKLAYEFAAGRNWRTVGIACEQANEYECYPVDEKIIVGTEWGDESQTFLDYIDCLIRVGGGDQSLDEVKTFRKQQPDAFVFEIELPRDKDD